MKVVYWKCRSLTDSDSFSIRTRTKREALRTLQEMGKYSVDYSEPYKVTIEYKDAFDLVIALRGEGNEDA